MEVMLELPAELSKGTMQRPGKNILSEVNRFVQVIAFLMLLSFPLNVIAQQKNRGIAMSSYYSKNELVFSGKLLSFFLVAYKEFTKTNKNLSSYEVLLLESESEVRITFVPNISGDEKILGGKTSQGESISYYVSKINHSIIKWHYHK